MLRPVSLSMMSMVPNRRSHGSSDIVKVIDVEHRRMGAAGRESFERRDPLGLADGTDHGVIGGQRRLRERGSDAARRAGNEPVACHVSFLA